MYKKLLVALIFIIPVSITAQTISSFDMGNTTLRKSKISNYYVVNLQKALNTCLGINIATDGVFGSGTSSFVRQFQGSQGMRPDGLVGFRTKEALNNCVASISNQIQNYAPLTSPSNNSTYSYTVPNNSNQISSTYNNSFIATPATSTSNTNTLGNILIQKPVSNNMNTSLNNSVNTAYITTVESKDGDNVIDSVNIAIKKDRSAPGTSKLSYVFSHVVIYLDNKEIGRMTTDAYQGDDGNGSYYFQLRNMNGFITKDSKGTLAIAFTPASQIHSSDLHGKWDVVIQDIIYYTLPNKVWSNKGTFGDGSNLSGTVSSISF